jgi:LPXTG-motif cell wall-anchored protein
MNHMRVVMTILAIVLVGTAMSPIVAAACPSCYGAQDSPMTDGMNMAILSLLGITGSVLVSFVGFFLYLKRRAMLLQRRFVNMLN